MTPKTAAGETAITAVTETVEAIAQAADWNQRVEAVRRIPERHGRTEQQQVYSGIAERLYRPHLAANFAFVPQREDYELDSFARAYAHATKFTDRFQNVSVPQLAALLTEHPESLLVFRTIIGYTPSELAVASREVAQREGGKGVGSSRVKSIERGARVPQGPAQILAETIDRLVSRSLWGEAPDGLRSKLDKIDTADGWDSVRRLAAQGVPYLRTGSRDQGEVATRFNLTMTPAPDFVLFEPPSTLRAILECKLTNDGGTARDKASRFRSLRQEAIRLGGVPVFALLDGLGWERINDALAPVVEYCDGRVFTLETLPEMLETEPFPRLVGEGGGRAST